MASKYDEAREAMDELMKALRDRHQALCLAVRFSEERHEPGILTYQQALHACKYWIDLGERVNSALRRKEQP